MVVIPVYWLCAFWLLIAVFRITADGSGPSPSFYWGHHPPAPTLSEYHQNLDIRLRFLYPYWIAATIITVLACGAVGQVGRALRRSGSWLFLGSFAVCLALLLLAQGISDVGTSLHFWRASMMYMSLSSVLWGLKVFVPLALLAGIIAVVRGSMSTSVAQT
jgi:hypothetical protein